MECNHDAAPALDSLLFLTDPLPKMTLTVNILFFARNKFMVQRKRKRKNAVAEYGLHPMWNAKNALDVVGGKTTAHGSTRSLFEK